jgi:hypothetical protein
VRQSPTVAARSAREESAYGSLAEAATSSESFGPANVMRARRSILRAMPAVPIT